MAFFLAACELSQSQIAQISAGVQADGKTMRVSLSEGSTAAQALAAAGVTPGSLDRADPPLYTVLRDGAVVKLTRVEERFRTDVVTLPFDRQTLRNDSIPEGQERMVQAGVNGEEELTYRAILEDGVQTSEAVVKTVVLKDPVPEIVMVGARTSFPPLSIPGRIAYLAGGNAWIMETTTANRRLLVNSADLDGRVFALSPDGSYLLFTRKSQKPPDQEINTLWVVKTDGTNSTPTSLNASNIVHFAAWYPGGSNAVAYSTVEPRANAPGWQANNDLYKVTIGGQPQKILDASSGGVYGWWGMTFAFAPNGRLAYSKPDGIGLVSQDGGYLAPLLEIQPFQTHADWAWNPGLSWGADSATIFFVDHQPGIPPATPEDSPVFDLRAFALDSKAGADLSPEVGMFAAPSASPLRVSGGERGYQLAYLQAIFPEQSDTSRYRLVVMDRDGSNRRVLFPGADVPGLEPQTPAWAPAAVQGQSGDFLSVLYQGNIWLIDSGSGEARQITGDGLASAIDWK
jgi:resuscitation-promoting factor RpfB